jgi:hypothetical protein
MEEEKLQAGEETVHQDKNGRRNSPLQKIDPGSL